MATNQLAYGKAAKGGTRPGMDLIVRIWGSDASSPVNRDISSGVQQITWTDGLPYAIP